MTTPAELRALADRCETATGPDRELDAKIARAVGRIPQNAAYVGTVKMGNLAWAGPCGYEVPAYTASIDAAMSLVPLTPPGSGNGKWAVRLDSGFYGATAELWHECFGERHHGHASGAHEALCRALAAAALRAHATISEQNP